MNRSHPNVQTDRLPPHSPEAEQGVLGCILLSPQEAMGECVTQFKAGAAVFYDLRHQLLYTTLLEMWDAGEPIDIITLQERLKTRPPVGALEQCGGLVYIITLPDVTPSAANLGLYAEIVVEKWLLRSVLRVLAEGETRIYTHDGEVGELLDTIEADVLAVNESRTHGVQRGMRELVSDSINQMEEMHRGVGLLLGLRTHFGYFDKKTHGLQRKKMIVIAGRPGTGKTSLAMNMVENIALIEKEPVGVFSLEMSADELTLRMMCSQGGVNISKLGDGFLAAGDFTRLSEAAKRLSRAPIHIDDTGGLSILELRARARRMKTRFKIKLLVVDYLQLMHSTNRKCLNREQEVADISGGLKSLSKELDLPVVVLSQLNRDAAKNRNRKPQLEDLRESGAIEQDADVVTMLYLPKQEGEDEAGYQDEVPVNGLIAKNRGGPVADVQFIFQKCYTRFKDAYGNKGKDGPSLEDIPQFPKQ